MAAIERLQADEGTKRRLLYGAMGLLGIGFVAAPMLPVATGVAQLLAVLLFGVMSGLWLGLLVWSL